MSSIVKRDEAVSPVIGTILLVAITVVLVAIVAAVVMGMVGGIGQSKDVGIIINPYVNGSSDGGYTLTMMSGKDTTSLTNVTSFMVTGEETYEQDATPTGNGQITEGAIGKTYYVKMASGAVGKSGQLTITGTFADGTQAVIYQGTITIPASTST